jgi:GTPase SAR1 family protein
MMNGQEVVFNIWDTSGEERTNSLARIYYRNAMVAIVVCDISDNESIETVQFWQQQV